MAQTADVLDGRLMGFYNGANLIAAATNCNVKITQATRNSSNKDSGKWDKTLSGRVGWSISGSGKFKFDATHGTAELFDAIVGQTLLTVLLSTQVALDIDYGGVGYLTDLSLDFPDSADSTYSFTFKGDGALAKTTH